MKYLERINTYLFTVLISVLFMGYIIYNTDSNYITLEKSQLEYYLNCSDYLELTGDTCERLKFDFEGPYPHITFDSISFYKTEPLEFVTIKWDSLKIAPLPWDSLTATLKEPLELLTIKWDSLKIAPLIKWDSLTPTLREPLELVTIKWDSLKIAPLIKWDSTKFIFD